MPMMSAITGMTPIVEGCPGGPQPDLGGFVDRYVESESLLHKSGNELWTDVIIIWISVVVD